MKEIKVQITPKIVLTTFAIMGAIYFGYLIREVLLILFIAFILNSGLRPLVNKLESYKIPRSLSVILIYLLLIGVLALIVALISGKFIDQLIQLANSLPSFAEEILLLIREKVPGADDYLNANDIQDIVADISKSVAGVENLSDIDAGQVGKFLFDAANVISQRGLSIIGGIAGGMLSVFTIFMVSIYMLQKKDDVYGFIDQLLSAKHAKQASKVIKKIEAGLGEWLIGQVILMFIIGLGSYIIVMIPRVFIPSLDYELYQYALVIALVAGLLEAIPQLGPLITIAIVFVLTLGTGASFPIVMYILVMFLALQQLEGILIVPMVMKRAVDIDPVITIVAIIAGFNLGGPVMAVLSIPIFVSFKIILYALAGNWKEDLDAKHTKEMQKPVTTLEKAKSFAERIQELAHQKKETKKQ